MNFINIPHNQNKYFHIYLNNSKEEIQKMKNTKNLRIKKIKVIIDYEIKSFVIHWKKWILLILILIMLKI